MNRRLKSEMQKWLRIVSFLGAIFFVAPVRAQLPMFATPAARSISGQFVIFSVPQISPLANQAAVLTNSEYVRLEPALLAVSAERIKKSLSDLLGDNSQWRGKIFLSLHPAQSLDENVTVVASRFDGIWNYRVELPDVLARARLTRAIVGASLLELANRDAGERSAEIPAWLMDGLSEQVLAANTAGFIVSTPTTFTNGLYLRRVDAEQSGLHLLAHAHEVLKDQNALTFEQLSWPSDAQLSGRDGGVYRASVQLFANDLLNLPNGEKELHVMLQLLPKYLNWQMAFHEAFKKDFSSQAELEKWWALQTINFAQLDIGPMWTAAASRAKLDEILSVPVEYRVASNSLPVHAQTSLQDAIRNFNSAQKNSILQNKLRDLQLAELRMSPEFAPLTAEYVKSISDYLGQSTLPQKILFGRHFFTASPRADVKKILKTLDELDAKRRNVETALDRPKPPSPSPALTGRESNL